MKEKKNLIEEFKKNLAELHEARVEMEIALMRAEWAKDDFFEAVQNAGIDIRETDLAKHMAHYFPE